MPYTVVFEETEDEGFIVSIPALPGCVSQAETHEQARQNIRDAMTVYIQDCIAAGDPVPVEKK